MDNEYYDYEDRRYINPTTSRDEQLGFVDNLRQTQANDLAKISRDTYNLGTHIPSTMGGLSGSGGLWDKQYVSPQTNAMLEGLKSTAQAQALNEAMTNYQNQLKQRYNKAYKAAAKRGGGGGGNGGGNTGGNDDVNGLVDYANLGVDFDFIDDGTKPSNASEYWLYNDATNHGMQINRMASENGGAGIDTGRVNPSTGEIEWGFSFDTGAPSRNYIQKMQNQGYKLYDTEGNVINDYASLFPDDN